jgi:hypothetical protein
MPVVGTLTVDLVANTAQFSGDLGKAAQDAEKFGDSATEAGGKIDYSMTEARHGVMLLGEEFGVHLPRGITSFIASLGPVGAAMEAAFPFLAIALGATLLIEHLTKLHESAEKLTESQEHFGITADGVFNNLDDKLLEAGIKADELSGNHLAALNKQLSIIDHTSLKELMQTFDIFGKEADAVFAQLKTHFYEFGDGSAGAKASLERFKAEYDALLAKGDDKGASALLDAKVQREQKILDLQKQAKDNQGNATTGKTGDYQRYEEAIIQLRQLGVGITDKEVAAQQTLVRALDDQATATQKVAELNKAVKDNAAQKTDNEIGGDQDKVYRRNAAEAKRAADEAEKAWETSYKEAVAALQESEKEKIAATQSGTKERIAAIDAALKEEQSKGLQDTAYYKSLLVERVKASEKEAEDEERLRQALAAGELKQTLAMARLQEKAEEESAKHKLALRTTTAAESARLEEDAVKKARDVEIKGLDDEIAALDKFDKEYLAKLQEFENRKKQITQQSENQITQIRDKAAEKQYQDIRAAEDKIASAVASTLAKSILQSKNMAQAFEQMGAQMVESALTNTLKMLVIQDKQKLSDAKTAAANTYAAVSAIPIVGPILAPPAAAAAFAGVMAFEKGGTVPGSGMGDTVPAMLSPGETVVSKALTDQVKSNSAGGRGGDVHVHTSINAVDAAGFAGLLHKHASVVSKHVRSELRKANKRG